MISTKQLKAARGLLEWSQTELGANSGISQTVITNIEKGNVRATAKTMTALCEALERAGVEFIEDGVRMRPQTLYTFQGEGFAEKFIQYMYKAIQNEEIKEACLLGINEENLSQEERESVVKNLEPLRSKEFSQRLLIKENMAVAIEERVNPKESYRVLHKEYFSDTTPCFIFGPYYAMMLYDERKVIVIKNKPLAALQKKIFNALWDKASIKEEL